MWGDEVHADDLLGAADVMPGCDVLDRRVTRMPLDFGEPGGLLMVSVFHFVTAGQHPRSGDPCRAGSRAGAGRAR